MLTLDGVGSSVLPAVPGFECPFDLIASMSATHGTVQANVPPVLSE